MNKLKGFVKSVETFENISFINVEVSGEIFKCVLLDKQPFIKNGNFVYLIFKETEVSIAKNFKGEISLSNKIECKINKIKKGKILTQIELSFENIKSIITTASAEKMSLKEGDTVTAMIKANEISIMEIVDG